MPRDIIPLEPPRATEPGDIVYDIPTTTRDHLQLRLYRDSDSEQVRHLFASCILEGQDSPVTRALRDQIYRNVLYNVGFVFVFYAPPLSFIRSRITALFEGSPNLPLVIWLILSFGYLSYDLYKVRGFFYAHCNRGLRESDLKDIGAHYYNPKARAQGSKMWVIEDVSKDMIIGCVGFDNSIPEPELRRLSVHQDYRRHGLGKILIATFLEHVEWYNKAVRGGNVKDGREVKEIMLGTTTYQPHAKRMYARNGWVLKSNTKLVRWVWGLDYVKMRKAF